MKLSIRKGFTLIEILIVVIILGILAAIVIPQFTNASNDAKVSAVQTTVQSVQAQLELYKFQMNAVPSADLTLWDSLGTKFVVDGTTVGPWIAQPAANPFSQSSAVSPTVATNNSAWCYDSSNNKFYGWANGTRFPN